MPKIKEPMVWQNVDIKNAEGKVLVTKECLCIGGFAIHAPVFGSEGMVPNFMRRPQYTITHIGTGLKLGYLVGSLVNALSLAQSLSERFHVEGNETRREIAGRIALKQEVKTLYETAALGTNFYNAPQWVDDVEERVSSGHALLYTR